MTELSHARRWVMFGFVLMGHLTITASIGSLNVALPSIEDHLHASPADLQWVIVLFQLGYATLLITGGRLGDVFGRRRVFMIGLTSFVAASLIAASAPTIEILIAARLLQGLAGGLTSPQVLAMVHLTFPVDERPKAFATFGVVSGGGFMLGQIMTGVMLHLDLFGLGWRDAFLFNVLVGLIALAGSAVLFPNTRSQHGATLDLTGALLACGAAVLLVYPLIQGRQAGWPVWYLGLVVAAAVLVWTFVERERRMSVRGSSPLLDLSLFRSHRFRVGLLIAVAFNLMAYPAFFVLTLTLQAGFGLDPFETAIATLAAPLTTVPISMLAGRYGLMLGRRIFVISGVTNAVGTALIMLAITYSDHPPDVIQLVPGLMLIGAGQGMCLPAMVQLTLTDVSSEQVGSASGLLQTVQQFIGVLGLAMFGIVFFGVVGSHPTDSSYVAALNWSMLLMIGCSAFLALCSVLLPAPSTRGVVGEVALRTGP